MKVFVSKLICKFNLNFQNILKNKKPIQLINGFITENVTLTTFLLKLLSNCKVLKLTMKTKSKNNLNIKTSYETRIK